MTSYAPQLSDRELLLSIYQQMLDIKQRLDSFDSRLQQGDRRFNDLERGQAELIRNASDDRQIIQATRLLAENNDRRIATLIDETLIEGADGKPVKIKEIVIKQQFSAESNRRLILLAGSAFSVIVPLVAVIAERLIAVWWP
jgi:hypothetical protein